MKKVLLLFAILFVSVITTACINNFAIQELNNKATLYMDRGDARSAICRLKSSLDLDDEIYQTHYNLALAYNSIGQYEPALVELKRVIELKPDFAEAYYILGSTNENFANQLMSREPDEEGNVSELSYDEISHVISIANASIDAYNEYLVKKVDAVETDEINGKIDSLNRLVKDFVRLQSENNESHEEHSQENASENETASEQESQEQHSENNE